MIDLYLKEVFSTRACWWYSDSFFRYKMIIGPRLRSFHSESQEAEALIACSILNTMIALGAPESFAITD
jgi:hypothetical protein